MKIFVVILNLFAIVCVAAGTNQGSVVNAVQSSVWKLPHFAHRRVEKRQTLSNLTTEDFARCSSAYIEHECSSGYAQEIINIALGCGYMAVARETSISCARNEGGQTCGAAVLDVSANETQTTNAATCSGAVTQGSCPSTCRSFLQFASSVLGCCVNTYINTTDSSQYFQYSDYVDYRLWNLCNVDLPPADCGNALPVNPPSNLQTCTPSEYLRRTLNYNCMASVGQPLVNALLQTSRCYPIAKILVDQCGTNANGDFCAEVFGPDQTAIESTNTLLQSLANCSASSKSTCTLSCQSAITNARNTFGCCVNIYNNSNFESEQSVLTYSYWNLCGVESPGFCTSTLSNATSVRAIAWLIFAAMTLVYVV